MTTDNNSTSTPKLIIELNGDRGEFDAFQEPNQWALMQNAEAAKGSVMDQMAGMYKLATSQVKEESLPALHAFLSKHGRDEDLIDKLGDALGALWAGETNIPKAAPSSDSSSSTALTDSTLTEPSSDQASEVVNQTLVDGSAIPV